MIGEVIQAAVYASVPFGAGTGRSIGFFDGCLWPLFFVWELAWIVIEEEQYTFGGMVTFLEAENEEKLLNFYKSNRFSQFDTRQTISDMGEPHELVQLLRLL